MALGGLVKGAAVRGPRQPPACAARGFQQSGVKRSVDVTKRMESMRQERFAPRPGFSDHALVACFAKKGKDEEKGAKQLKKVRTSFRSLDFLCACLRIRQRFFND